MKRTLITGTLAALSLAGMLALPAAAQTTTPTSPSPTTSASPSDGDGRGCPDGFDAGDAAGVRICHGTEGWRLDTTDPAKSGAHEYTGQISSNGKITDVYLVRPENDDSATVDGEGRLNIDFKTYSGIDGVDFRVDGGTELTFNLSVDGQQLPPRHIWLGDKARHPETDPFTLPIHRDRDVKPATSSATPTSGSAS